MVVASRRLFGPLLLTATDAVVYTVPAGRTAVIRSLILCNFTGTARSVNLRVNGTGSADICWSTTVPLGASIAAPDDLILNPGDQLRGVAAAITSITIAGYGSLLVGAPT